MSILFPFDLFFTRTKSSPFIEIYSNSEYRERDVSLDSKTFLSSKSYDETPVVTNACSRGRKRSSASLFDENSVSSPVGHGVAQCAASGLSTDRRANVSTAWKSNDDDAWFRSTDLEDLASRSTDGYADIRRWTIESRRRTIHPSKQPNWVKDRRESRLVLIVDFSRRGELTELGRGEHRAIGSRMYRRFSNLFHQRPIVNVMTSGKKRAMDSAEEFLVGLAQSSDRMQIFEEKTNKKLLYFHRSCPNYLAFKHNNTQVRQKLESIKKLEKTRTHAQKVLKRIFKEEFVNLLIQGRFQNESIDPSSPKNEVDLVICLYSMFSIAPAHQPSQLSKLLIKYFSCDESSWFGYINDAQVTNEVRIRRRTASIDRSVL